jgi:RNA polymerase sigma factor (sigma-70 family)
MAPQPNPNEIQDKRARMLDEVMRSDRRQLRRRARRYSLSPPDADDAIEDACVAFLRHFDGDSGDHAARWMMVTVKHAALEIVRRHNLRKRFDAAPRSPDQHDEWWETNLRDGDATPEEQAETREWVSTRLDLLAELKPDERTALSLLAAGYSYREIGERHGWTHTKVNRCVAEGRVRLRELLALGGSDREREA